MADKSLSQKFDCIVVGGGHAGIEASLASSRLGLSTLLVTSSIDSIGRLSCNPAIGGLAKGNIVREIDALGGEMGRLADQSMIQFRILNASRGPAVQAPRIQADRDLYSRYAKLALFNQKNLSLFQDTVVDLLIDGGVCVGVRTERGGEIAAKRVIVTTGTFMKGRLFIGAYSTKGGRLGERSADLLGDSLRSLGYNVNRLKTGTPARVHARNIDYAKLEEQKGDPPQPFSFSCNRLLNDHDLPCWITWTNRVTHQIICDNITHSPLYGGKIVGTGPRYCPSVEDKVMRFPDRDRHHVFVEPEGIDSEEVYLNGLSSSLPEEVQEKFIRTIPGLEAVEIIRPGYAVEYDYIDPTLLYPSLESKLHPGVWFAGQTNGTSGYEEAAAQGLLAGINVALSLGNEPPLIIGRYEGYIGVLIDDLVTLGTKEPYRMFTSRAEYRLSLRHGSADIRLLPKAERGGLLPANTLEQFKEKRSRLEVIGALLNRRSLNIEEARRIGGNLQGRSFRSLLCDSSVDDSAVMKIIEEEGIVDKDFLEEAVIEVKYQGYAERQRREIDRMRKMESMTFPVDFDWDNLPGISSEGCEKLAAVRPLSVGQAMRISGVRPTDIAILTALRNDFER